MSKRRQKLILPPIRQPELLFISADLFIRASQLSRAFEHAGFELLLGHAELLLSLDAFTDFVLQGFVRPGKRLCCSKQVDEHGNF